jgi:hypothetical protein
VEVWYQVRLDKETFLLVSGGELSLPESVQGAIDKYRQEMRKNSKETVLLALKASSIKELQDDAPESSE